MTSSRALIGHHVPHQQSDGGRPLQVQVQLQRPALMILGACKYLLKDTNIFDQALRGIKFQLILVINDSFYS